MPHLHRIALYITIGLGLLSLTSPVQAKKRAFLIGISDYKNIDKLTNPPADVKSVGDKLKSVGYVVTTVRAQDTIRTKLLEAYDKFLNTVDRGDEVLVFYAGHGIDIDGANMLVPADAPSSKSIAGENSLEQQLVPMRPLMTRLADLEPAIQIWIIDACRDNPYSAGGRPYLKSGGLHEMTKYTPVGTAILFAAKYNQTARDSLPTDTRPGMGSPFSRSFVRIFDKWKDKDFRQYAVAIRQDVIDLVKPYDQFPVYEDAVPGQWCFVECSVSVQQIVVSQQTPGAVRKRPDGITNTTYTAPSGSPGRLPDYSGVVGDQPVVFLGKKSAVGCKPGNVSDQYPFGCGTLQRISKHYRTKNTDLSHGLVGVALTARTTINVLGGVPMPGPSGTIYGCKVRVLDRGSSVKVASTVAFSYADDTFYWAAIEGPPPVCAPSQDRSVQGDSQNSHISGNDCKSDGPDVRLGVAAHPGWKLIPNTARLVLDGPPINGVASPLWAVTQNEYQYSANFHAVRNSGSCSAGGATGHLEATETWGGQK